MLRQIPQVIQPMNHFFQASPPMAANLLGTLDNSVSAPYIVQYPQQPETRKTLYSNLPAFSIARQIPFLTQTIEEPYIVLYLQQPNVMQRTLSSFASNVIAQQIGWLDNSIYQPTPGPNIQQSQIPFLQNVQTLTQRVPLNTISQPVGSVTYLIPKVFSQRIVFVSGTAVKLQGYSHGWSYPI